MAAMMKLVLAVPNGAKQRNQPQIKSVVQLHLNFADNVREIQRFGSDLAALGRIVSPAIAVMPRAVDFPI